MKKKIRKYCMTFGTLVFALVSAAVLIPTLKAFAFGAQANARSTAFICDGAPYSDELRCDMYNSACGSNACVPGNDGKCGCIV